MYAERVADDAVHLFTTLRELMMANAGTDSSTKTTPRIEIAEAALKIREQMLSTIKQGQKLTIDAAQGWVKVVSVLPIPDLPRIPGVPAIPTIGAAASSPSMSPLTYSTRSAITSCNS
jgi:hypothetical protein